MKSFRILVYVALLCSALLVPRIAGAVLSDQLIFTETNTLTGAVIATAPRDIVEVPGESVGEIVDLHIADSAGSFSVVNAGNITNRAYLVEPGANVTSATPLAGGILQYTGFRSDTITLHLNQEAGAVGGESISITLNSDEDPGTHDVVTGYLEDGTLQDITTGIFTAADLAIFAALGDTVKVQVMSDVETTTSVPEPATLFLLGLGLFGAGIVGRKIKK